MLAEGVKPELSLARARIYPAESRGETRQIQPRMGKAAFALLIAVVLQSKYKESGRISRNLVLMNRNVFRRACGHPRQQPTRHALAAISFR